MKTRLLLKATLFVFSLVMLNLGFNLTVSGQTTRVWDGGGDGVNWNSANNWNPDGVPASIDPVEIPKPFTVHVNSTTAVGASLVISSAGTGIATVILDAGSSLTISGRIDVGGPVNANRPGILTFNSGATLTAGSVYLNNDISITTKSEINMTAGGTLNTGEFGIAGTAAAGNAIWTYGTGTVHMTASNTLPTSYFTAFYNLVIEASTTTSFNNSSKIINNHLSINGLINLGVSTGSTAATLSLGGAGMINGTYGGTGSGATYIKPLYFTGSTGYLTANTSTCTTPQGSLTANGPICGSGTGQLTWTATAGYSPFTVVYNDGTTTYTQNDVISGIPFDVPETSIPSVTIYTLVSVTGAGGCSRTSDFTSGTASITIYALPTVDAGADGHCGSCASAPDFQINATVSAVEEYSMLWTGDGSEYLSSPVAQSPSFDGNGAGPGTYTLTLTVTDGHGCINSDDITITVDEITAEAGPGVSIGSCGTAADFQINATASGTGLDYQWSGDGTAYLSSTAIEDPVFGLDAPVGTYTLTLTVTDDYGCTASDDVIIVVDPLPTAEAGYGGNIGSCSLAVDFPINATVTGTGPLTLEWTGDGAGYLSSTSIEDPTFDGYNPGPGEYHLTLVVTDIYGCTASDNLTITVDNLPTVDCGEGGNTGACSDAADYQIQAVSTGIEPLTYLWTGDGADYLSNPVIEDPLFDGYGAGPGSYTLTLTVTDVYGCESSDNITLIVDAFPTAEAGNGGNIGACDNAAEFQINASASGTGKLTYLWTGSGSANLSDIYSLNPSFDGFGAGPGSHTLTLTVTDYYGCTASDNVTITVDPIPTADAGEGGTIGDCEGESYHLAASATGTGPFSYLWTGDGAAYLDNTELPDPTFASSPAGSYELFLTVTDKYGCQASDNVTIIVEQLQTFDVSGTASICKGNSTIITLSGSQYSNEYDYLYDLYANDVLVPDQTKTGTGNALTWTVSPTNNTMYTVKARSSIYSCERPMNGSAKVMLGPVTAAPVMLACPGSLIYVPITVTDFEDVEAISLVLHYSSGEMTFAGFENTSGSPVQFTTSQVLDLPLDETYRQIRIGKYLPATGLPDNAVLITLKFNYPESGGTKYIEWYDEDDISCEYGFLNTELDPPEIVPFCDDLTSAYYIDGQITEKSPATVEAGPDQNVCEDVNTVQMTGYSYGGGASGGVWSGGFGTWAGDVYTPTEGEKTGGSVILIYTTTGAEPCANISDTKTVYFKDLPFVNAGDNQIICADGAVTLAGSVGGGTTAATWSGGTGSFDPDPTTLNAAYTPSLAEIAAGTVTLTLTTTDANPCMDISDNMTVTINPLPVVTAVSLQSSINQADWFPVSGTLNTQYEMCIDPLIPFHYIDIDNLALAAPANPLTTAGFAQNAFFLDETSVPAGFFPYWAAKGVVEGASGWQGIMWNIISGYAPMFYIAYTGSDYQLIDGLQFQTGAGTFPLRVSGDYPQGLYKFNGTVTDVNGCVSSFFDVFIEFNSSPVVEEVSLLTSTDQANWFAVSGTLDTHYEMCINPLIPFHYIDIDNLVLAAPANPLTTAGFAQNAFFLDETSVPAGFFPYWAAMGVVEGASGWQGVMWNIISGNAPMFYIAYTGSDYQLIDGLQFQTGAGTFPLRVSGDYSQGLYKFSGTVTDVNGCVSSFFDVFIEFNSSPVVEEVTLLSSLDETEWVPVSGNLETGYDLCTDPVIEFQYLDIDVLSGPVNELSGNPEENAFYLYGTYPESFFDYWAGKGVVEGAGGWQGIMWTIINGVEPMFFIKYTDGDYQLIDGLQYIASGGLVEETLRVSGDYPQDLYAFRGTVTDVNGCVSSFFDIFMQFNSSPVVEEVSLLSSPDENVWEAVSGDLETGYNLCIDPAIEFQYLDIDVLSGPVNELSGNPEENAFYLYGTYPESFFAYWAGKGVVEGATGWQGIMWTIINGDAPIFYIKYSGGDYQLIDGLQYLASGGLAEETLRVSGDYPQDLYTFRGAVTDVNGCISSFFDIFMQFNTIPALSAISLDVTCFGANDGSIDLAVTGNGPFTYAWTNGDLYTYDVEDPTGLGPGTYTVTVTDALGCQNTLSRTILEPTQLEASVTDKSDVICKGDNTGSVTVEAALGTGTPPYSYSINNGVDYYPSGNFNNLYADTYTIKVKDGNECFIDVSVKIFEPLEALTAEANESKKVTCVGYNDGEATITASGGWTLSYVYSIDGVDYSNITGVFSGLTAGEYTLYVKDDKGCVAFDQVTVTEPATALTCSALETNKVTCKSGNDGEATITGHDGWGSFIYSDDNVTYGTSGVFGGLSAGDHTFYVKDAEGCVSTCEITITEPTTALTCSALETKKVTCKSGNDGEATITGHDGWGSYTYSDDGFTYGSSGVFGGLPAGDYTFYVKDAEGCISNCDVTIHEPASSLTADAVETSPVTCNGGSDGIATITAGGGWGSFSYSKDGIDYSNTTGVFTGLSMGNYVLYVKDDEGCITSDPVSITETDVLTATVTSTNANCNGANDGTITVKNPAGGHGNYQASIGSGWIDLVTTCTFSNLAPVSYSVSIRDKDYPTCVVVLTTLTLTEPTAVSLSGTVNYFNIAEPIPIQNATVELKQGNSTIYGPVSVSAGSYTFPNVCSGTYDIVINKTTPTGNINATDASQVNSWGAAATPKPSIEKVRLFAGDVSGDSYFPDNFLQSSDANLIVQYFVNGGSTIFDRPAWTFWPTNDLINYNPGPVYQLIYPTVTFNAGDPSKTINFWGLVTGDFNRYFSPSSKDNPHNLDLVYDDNVLLGAGMDFELPIRTTSAMDLTAVSMILYFPSDLVEVTNVSMTGSSGRMQWAVKGNELRIGWFTTTPISLQANADLLTLNLHTTAGFLVGQTIRFELSNDPLNELADASNDVIPGAVLSMDVVESTTFGLPDNPAMESLTLVSYPNPFAEYSTITYNIPFDGHVNLQLDDMTGRTVAMIVNEYQTTGKYSIKVDALPLQPGVYSLLLRYNNGSGDQWRQLKLIRQQ